MKFQNWTKAATLAATCMLVSCILVGCPAGRYVGGGWIPSAVAANKKATFGFMFQGVDQDGDGLVDQMVEPVFFPGETDPIFVVWWLGQGQLNYKDKAAGVQFHFDCGLMTHLPADWPDSTGSSMYAVIDEDHYIATGEVIILSLVWEGSYTSSTGTGHVSVSLTANGDGIGGVDDMIEVALTGGPYDGYQNAGTLQGGNIQWIPSN
jgi:hypothetical protein